MVFSSTVGGSVYCVGSPSRQSRGKGRERGEKEAQGRNMRETLRTGGDDAGDTVWHISLRLGFDAQNPCQIKNKTKRNPEVWGHSLVIPPLR